MTVLAETPTGKKRQPERRRKPKQHRSDLLLLAVALLGFLMLCVLINSYLVVTVNDYQDDLIRTLAGVVAGSIGTIIAFLTLDRPKNLKPAERPEQKPDDPVPLAK